MLEIISDNNVFKTPNKDPTLKIQDKSNKYITMLENIQHLNPLKLKDQRIHNSQLRLEFWAPIALLQNTCGECRRSSVKISVAALIFLKIYLICKMLCSDVSVLRMIVDYRV